MRRGTGLRIRRKPMRIRTPRCPHPPLRGPPSPKGKVLRLRRKGGSRPSPTMYVIARSEATWQSPGVMIDNHISKVHRKCSMLIGYVVFILRCWRLPRHFVARNDTVVGSWVRLLGTLCKLLPGRRVWEAPPYGDGGRAMLAPTQKFTDFRAYDRKREGRGPSLGVWLGITAARRSGPDWLPPCRPGHPAAGSSGRCPCRRKCPR